MNRIERKAADYVNARKVHLDAYTIDKDSGAIITATGHVEGTSRWTVTVTPEGTTCDCPYGEARGQTTRPHSHDTALKLAVWQMEKLHEQ